MFRLFHTVLTTVMIIALLFQADICNGQNKYALLIGIGDYPEKSGWNKIHGDNDIPIIKDCLIKQGFESSNIATLINSDATKAAIFEKFDNILSKVSKGDLIYIHFSGHGQQVTDLNGDESDGWDEAWIPYDAKRDYSVGVYEGQYHLIDDELNQLFMKFRVKLGPSGKIVVVADACHSGGGSRGLHDDEDEDYVRGTGYRFELPQVTLNKKAKSEPEEWLFVAACKPNESNHEYKSPSGTWYGTLSYVISTDNSVYNSSKYKEVLERWNNSIRSINVRAKDIMNNGQPSRRSAYLF